MLNGTEIVNSMLVAWIYNVFVHSTMRFSNHIIKIFHLYAYIIEKKILQHEFFNLYAYIINNFYATVVLANYLGLLEG